MSDVAPRLSAALADRYRIEHELGAGGMATVYLAEDLRHQRQVAIKVLKPELAAVLGAERFVQEITTTAQLQHPHILPLFDSGTADGFLFYVMPYIEGETLRDRLNRETQLGVGEAVRITREVADALDYAHRHGVIHRDIKPENILLHDGRPMVADFGIALAVSAAAGGRMTETGLSLGTPHYMSPEQATAEKDLTGRSDVYSLASVLYEMLTGDPPHTGSSAQQIIMKIVTEEAAPVTKLRRSVPPNVAAAVAKALEKLPADRFESAKAFADALADPSFTTASAAIAAPASLGRSRMTIYVLGAVCLVLAAATAYFAFRPPPTPPASRQRVILWDRAPGSVLDPGNTRLQASQAAISPDGSEIVYSEPTDSGFVLMRKDGDEALATPLAGTTGGVAPFFSPDGRWIGYRSVDGKLKKVPVVGGGSVTLVDNVGLVVSAAATWLDDGTIVYGAGDGLRRVSASGDSTWVVRKYSGSQAGARLLTLWPLPKSRGVLYTYCSGNCAVRSSVRALDLRTGQDRLLVSNAVGAWYVPGGYLVFTDRAGGLYGVELDVDRLTVTSGRVPLIPGVEPGNFTLSAKGSVLYASPGAGGGEASELMWVARDGAAVPLDTMWKADFNYPAISPDGKTLAVSVSGETTQLWLRHADGAREPLTQQAAVNWRPAWTADGRSVVFPSNRGGDVDSTYYDLYRMAVNHSSPAQRLVHFTYPVWEGEISADGQWVVFRSDEEQTVSLIHARRIPGDTATRQLLGGDGVSTFNFTLSPDGRWIAYELSKPGADDQIYVASFPNVTAPRQVSQSDGSEPRWARGGRELFYKSGGELMAVDIEPEPTLTIGSPHALFSVLPYRSANNRQQYDVAPDGRHFVMIRNVTEGPETVVYIEHWFSELRAKMHQ